MDNIKHLFKQLFKRSKQSSPKEVGQGLVEYAMILIFVGIATVAIVQVMGPTITNTFDRFVRQAPVAPPALVNYTPPPTFTATATTDPNVPATSTSMGPIASSTPPSVPPTETPVPPTETPVPPTETPVPPTDTPVPPPCPYAAANVPANGAVTVQAENYMCGGQGIAYNDDGNTDTNDSCTNYRTDENPGGVDLENSGDSDGSCSIGYINANEWVRYEVNTASSVQHYFTLRIASAWSGRIRIRISNEFDTQETNALTLPVTGGWTNWTDYIVDEPLSLIAGTTNYVEIYTENDGFNLNYFTVSTSPPATPSPDGILFVVGNTNLNSGDRAVRDHLQNDGYTVIVVSNTASNTADATGKELVIISSTGSSGDVGSKFRDVNVPVIVWEHALFDNMEMTNNNNHSTDGGEDEVNIRDSSHALAAGFPNGMVTISNDNQTLTYGNPNNNANEVVTTDNQNNRFTIFGFDTGKSMDGGFIAPAKRVGFFFTDNTAANINNNGWALFDATVNWAMSP